MRLIQSSDVKEVKLTELFNIAYGKNIAKSELTKSGTKVFGANGLIGYTQKPSIISAPTVTITSRGSGSGYVSYLNIGNAFLTNNLLYLNENKNTHNNDIILWGLSLGGAVTSKIACENDFKAVILQSTFTNIKDMGLATLQKNLHLPYTEYLVNFVPFFQRYDTYSRIDKIKVPLLIIHSKNDSLIPYKLAEKNAKKAKFAKFHLVEQDNHNDYTNSLPIILDFLDSVK